MSRQFSTRSAGVKRILREAKDIAEDDSITEFHAAPLEDELFEWHFTIKVPDAEFAGGIYHGRIILPAEYPLKPPDVILLTPNGRFELNRKICLTITGFHQEAWQPAWGIRTALMALQAFFTTEAKGAIGGIDAPKEERSRLAKLSGDWTCSVCGQKNKDLVKPDATPAGTGEKPAEATPEASTPPQPREEPVAITEDAVPALPEQAGPAPEVETRAAEVLYNPLAGPPPAVHAPVWIDRLIGVLLICIVALLARKLSVFGESNDSTGSSSVEL